jgi:hypothetical protein
MSATIRWIATTLLKNLGVIKSISLFSPLRNGGSPVFLKKIHSISSSGTNVSLRDYGAPGGIPKAISPVTDMEEKASFREYYLSSLF